MGALGVLPPPAPSTGQAPFAEAGKVLGQGPEALPVEALLMDAALEAVEGFAQRLLLCDLQSSCCTSPPHQASLAEAPPSVKDLCR
mmetsp:Transcript_50101/g.109096  ORF Transcript_50101/g.109096 Transcript_50101/m.109096 type:complete len:86 (-) Transcript_50101:150-407(-)